ncbi:MAG: hypothetical protein HKO98_13870 [Gemmatimonadetes bacterium]|nr:hypothetical protein [Gemmatimonadota bacterium]
MAGSRPGPAPAAVTLGRTLLLALLAWFTLRQFADADYRGIWAGLNLVLHEAGHLALGWFGSAWLSAIGGTAFHLACIGAVGVAFWRQQDRFAVAVTVWWAGTVFVEAAPYIADARVQNLPLVTVGDGPVSHDWFVILDGLGLLARDQQLGGLARASGLALLVAGLVGGASIAARAARSDGDVDGVPTPVPRTENRRRPPTSG